MKKRLDVYLTEQGFAPSRERAKAIIMSGCVFVDNQKAEKAGFIVPDGATVEVRGDKLKYVSRGGLKLEKAIEFFNIDLKDSVCIDIGASTGGFTDCMLQNGAAKVYCIDVGYGQLAWRLRTDSRVVNIERKNIRYITNDEVPEVADFISIDVSFISLRLVFPVAYKLLGGSGSIVALVKPQFEAGRDKVGKKGVVRDIETHIEVLENVTNAAREAGFQLYGITHSPIKGPEGNIEYLMCIGKCEGGRNIDVSEVARNSHCDFFK
jgi:23S rRNA (cytidine1920-2'-O)/16S rRNA (cytidine1409-2'-O)-methyltransferase